MHAPYSHTSTAGSSALAVPGSLRWVAENWFNLIILGLMLHLLFQKEISIRFQLYDRTAAVPAMITPIAQPASNQSTLVPPPAAAEQALPAQQRAPVVEPPAPAVKQAVKQDRRANDFSNLTLVLSPTYAQRKGIPAEIVAEKMDNLYRYVRHYLPIARREMRQHGIPVSITLAQGLLESNAGDSRLSRESNNHFGIKCRSKCRGCTCRNYTDDDIYDMFRVFEHPVESFEEHSKLLTGKRYRHLLKLDKTDYKRWAHGLKKAGYATDKRYAEKLIKIIETLELHKYDVQA